MVVDIDTYSEGKGTHFGQCVDPVSESKTFSLMLDLDEGLWYGTWQGCAEGN